MKLSHLAILLALALPVFSSPAASAASSGWTPIPIDPKTIGLVDVIAEHGDKVYIGGRFDSIGSLAVHHVAMWDGIEWHALGSGTNQSVAALGFASNGNLIVGGSFDTAGGEAMNSVALWNGGSWSPMGTGVKAFGLGVHAILTTSEGQIYIGGDFEVNGDGDTVHNLAHYTGGKWQSVGGGVQRWRGALPVFDLAETPWGIAAAGYFMAAGDKPGSGVALYEGASWHPLFSQESETHVSSIAVRGNELYIAASSGLFLHDGMTTTTMAAPEFRIGDLEASPSALYAFGSPLESERPMLHFAARSPLGTTVNWQPLDQGLNAAVTSSFYNASTSQILVAGFFTSAGGEAAQGLAIYSPYAEVAKHQDAVRSLDLNGSIVRVPGNPSRVLLSDLLGRVIAQFTDRLAIDLSSLVAGTYFIRTPEHLYRITYSR